MKQKILKKPNEHKAQRVSMGFTAYVGSPVNGEMVIGNPVVVDEWLSYIRNAQREKVVNPDQGILTADELGKLLDICILSGTRHEFNLKYDTHPGLKCVEHKHDKRIWESAAYPVQLVSCECFDNQ